MEMAPLRGVLVVDDDDDIRLLLEELLRGAGYAVSTAPDGRAALRFTAPRTRRAYVYPARHYASSSNDPSLPPMGLRVRLKASVNVASFPRQARVVLRALQRYGMILADNGSPWYVSGAPNRHWSNDALHTLGRLTGTNFEVVDTSSLPEPGN